MPPVFQMLVNLTVTWGPLHIVQTFDKKVITVVLDVVVTALFHRSTRMLVQITANTVNVVKAPFNLLAKWHHVLLDNLVKRSHVELGVFKEV